MAYRTKVEFLLSWRKTMCTNVVAAMAKWCNGAMVQYMHRNGGCGLNACHFWVADWPEADGKGEDSATGGPLPLQGFCTTVLVADDSARAVQALATCATIVCKSMWVLQLFLFPESMETDCFLLPTKKRQGRQPLHLCFYSRWDSSKNVL